MLQKEPDCLPMAPWLFSVGAQNCYPGTKLKSTSSAATFASTGPYFNGTMGKAAE